VRVFLALTTLAVFAAGTAAIAANADSSAIRGPEARNRFVLDVVRMAVALPQADPQDRLRVLSSAASVVGPLDRNLERQLAREGAHLEAELANSGHKPAVSMLVHLDAIRTLPPSERARQAAAHGFASGTAGDRKSAERYFDMAFAATNEVWAQRTPQKNAAAVVEEVSEAAAQVDPVSALTRAQSLEDPSAQAIGMLAVARVVMGK
jgi:hypothetical protein